MTAQWVKFDGSDEQIANIEKALEGYVLRLEAVSGTHQTELLYRDEWDKFGSERIIEYLICSPHPYADMICQWARTGQPVYVRITEDGDKNEFPELSDFIESVKHVETYCTNTPNWNIPGAEHSFTQFDGVV